MHLFALALLVALAVGFDAAPKLVGRAPFWQFLADPNYVFLGIQALLLQIWNYRASLSWNIPSWSISAEMHIHRSEEHTSELQSLMRISYAVFCLKKKKHKTIYSI